MVQVEILLSQFEKEQYNFTQFDSKFVFTSYFLMSKEKGKRKWDVKTRWDKYNERSNNAPQPELPSYVILEANDKAKNQIEILTWEQYKKE